MGEKIIADKKVESNYVYPKNYKVKGVTEQVNILRQIFPCVGFVDKKITEQPLPLNAEGWFAIPKWEKFAPTYGEAVEKILAMIASRRMFYNYRKNRTGPKYLRQHIKTMKMFQKLGDKQKGHDIFVVPCQSGLFHRGQSVRRARKVFMTNEFGLGSFAVGIILLTHPEREAQWGHLHIDCAGDEFASKTGGDFCLAPIFCSDSDGLKFGTGRIDYVSGNFGSASGFLL